MTTTTSWQLVDRGTQEVVIDHLELAVTFWSRLKGLQFRASLAPYQGLLLSPCSSLHTCCMRFAIDVVMLNRRGDVVGFRNNVRPWRALNCVYGTKMVLETSVGELPLEALRSLQLRGSGKLPRCLREMSED